MDFVDSTISGVRSAVYKNFFGATNPISTINGFYESIKSIPDNASILDVGCGDGIYYTGEKVIALIKAKNLTIHSIDVDDGAIPICQKRIKLSGLSDRVTSECIDLMKITKRYDAILFMESFPVIPRDLMTTLIQHAKTISDELLLFHNLVEDKNSLIEWVKPRIKYLTLVDFGQLTSVEEMEEECQKWGFKSGSYNVEPCLQCTYRDMHWALNVPGFGDTVITQYLVSLQTKAQK